MSGDRTDEANGAEPPKVDAQTIESGAIPAGAGDDLLPSIERESSRAHDPPVEVVAEAPCEVEPQHGTERKDDDTRDEVSMATGHEVAESTVPTAEELAEASSDVARRELSMGPDPMQDDTDDLRLYSDDEFVAASASPAKDGVKTPPDTGPQLPADGSEPTLVTGSMAPLGKRDDSASAQPMQVSVSNEVVLERIGALDARVQSLATLTQTISATLATLDRTMGQWTRGPATEASRKGSLFGFSGSSRGATDELSRISNELRRTGSERDQAIRDLRNAKLRERQQYERIQNLERQYKNLEKEHHHLRTTFEEKRSRYEQAIASVAPIHGAVDASGSRPSVDQVFHQLETLHQSTWTQFLYEFATTYRYDIDPRELRALVGHVLCEWWASLEPDSGHPEAHVVERLGIGAPLRNGLRNTLTTLAETCRDITGRARSTSPPSELVFQLPVLSHSVLDQDYQLYSRCRDEPGWVAKYIVFPGYVTDESGFVLPTQVYTVPEGSVR